MKKLLATIIALSFAFAAFAQEDHLQFKGIPIAGDPEEFAKQLEQRKCTAAAVSSSSTFFMCEGEFLGRSSVLITASHYAGNVWRVDARMKLAEDAEDALTECDAIVGLYTQKYGKPAVVKKELVGIKTGKNIPQKADYILRFCVAEGSIEIHFEFKNTGGYSALDHYSKLNISYTDKAGEIAKNQAIFSEM